MAEKRNKMPLLKIRKRDGRIVAFDREKITNAVYKATVAVGRRDRRHARKLSDHVVELLDEQFDGHTIPTVEEVQDIVEKVLREVEEFSSNSLQDDDRTIVVLKKS